MVQAALKIEEVQLPRVDMIINKGGIARHFSFDDKSWSVVEGCTFLVETRNSA